MPRYFTQYWENDWWGEKEWYRQYRQKEQGKLLNHTAGNLFRKRGVRLGDMVYVVTVLKGKLYLLANLQVAKVCDYAEAADDLGDDLWLASDHIIASAAKIGRAHV